MTLCEENSNKYRACVQKLGCEGKERCARTIDEECETPKKYQKASFLPFLSFLLSPSFQLPSLCLYLIFLFLS